MAAKKLADAAGDELEDRLGAIAAAGGITPLVGLVTTGNLIARERAASALWHLAVDAASREAIVRAGGIPSLCQLLDDGTAQATQHAVGTLDRIAHENPEAQMGIAKKLVSLLAQVCRSAEGSL